MTDLTDHERILLLEERLRGVRKEMKRRRNRDRWVAGTVIALSAVVVAVVLPFIVARGGT